MTVDEGTQHALGYAAGREDASGIRTVTPAGLPDRIGFIDFAAAYAAGWDDYNHERRFCMTNCRDAYDTWQSTEGRTIFREYMAGQY